LQAEGVHYSTRQKAKGRHNGGPSGSMIGLSVNQINSGATTSSEMRSNVMVILGDRERSNP
jgi:hypothetical protein